MPRSPKTALTITLGLLFVAGLLAARIGLPQPDPLLSGSSARPSTRAVSETKERGSQGPKRVRQNHLDD